MASITIDKLNDVDSSFSKDNYLVIGQGQIGKKTTIQNLFDLTKDSSSNGARINYISYTLDQGLTNEQKERARQNLGINEQGKTIESGVSSVNGNTGDVTIYLTDLKASTDNPNKPAKDYIDEEIYNEIYGNKDTAHNVDPGAHANAIEAAVNSAITKLDITESISSAIITHNNSNGAHAEAFAKFASDTLSGYATKYYIDSKLSGYAKKSDVPSRLSDLTDGLNTIYTIKGISGGTITPTGTDRSVTISASFIGALPISGGTLTGNLTMGSSSKILINNTMYGTTLPSSGANGQIFFLLESS